MTATRVIALTAAALAGFAANSLLCRAALGEGSIDAASFTAIRLAAGAVTLALLARVPLLRGPGSWASAAALFAYAAAFSFAYLRLTTATGALVLFAMVQATMIGSSVTRPGDDRPRALEWAGLVLAAGGLVALTAPGLEAPDPLGAALMALAGIAWGVYSLRGRGAQHPLGVTADNFARSLPMAAVLLAVALPITGGHATGRGAVLAIASGAVASGLGYSLWYAALPHLVPARAAIVQLGVPVLAAIGGVVALGEVVTPRLAGAAAAILGGVGLALVARRRPKP